MDEEVSAVVLAVVVVAGVFASSQFFLSNRAVEPFSELGVLGPEMKIGGYPKEIHVNEPLNLYLYLGNHEGRVMYYRVYVKLGDRSTVVNENVSAKADVVAMFEAVLAHNQNLTLPVSIVIGKPVLGGRLIFEMWVYDEGVKGFRYNGRWLQIWLNVTQR